KGIREIEAKERRDASDKAFIENAQIEIADKLKGLKKRHADLKANEQVEIYKRASEISKRLKSLKDQHNKLRLKASEPTAKQLYETEKQMNTPLQERLDTVLAEKKSTLEKLRKDLNKSLMAKEPRPIKELIRDKIHKAEKELKELEG